MKGSRVQAVVQELRGEKIDIVPYDADPVKFVCNAIAPAEVARVLMDVGSHTMQLIVPDEKLSLAIGKKGQNVRLASQLTGWRIDIHSASKVREMEQRARQSLAAIFAAVAARGRRRGAAAGGPTRCSRPAGARRPRSRGAKPEELTGDPGRRQRRGGQAIIKAAGPAAEAERVRQAAEAARARRSGQGSRSSMADGCGRGGGAAVAAALEAP